MPAVLALQERFNFTSHAESPPLFYIHFFILRADTTVVGEAFRHHEIRKVDKGGCISFQGRKYETKTQLIGRNVEISYDPAEPQIITVSHEGIEPFQAEPLQIQDYCNAPQILPDHMQETIPETSRFLDALEKRYAESVKRRADAISFGGYKKEVSDHV